MDLNHLPIIDWDLSIKLVRNNKILAKEIIDLLIKNLKNDLHKIQFLFEKQKVKELYQHIHQLHGALCYCGLPRLKKLLDHLETDLKNNIMDNLPSLLTQLDIEVHLLLAHYPSLPSA